ncbi:MAG: carboxypeptidase regulatory-like domain-containing protein [Balneolaceae bacterium]
MFQSIKRVLFVTGAAFSLLFSSCSYFNEADSAESAAITGSVIHESSGDAIGEAVVRITQPQVFQESTVTDDDGVFTFQGLQIEDDVQITLEIMKVDYSTVYREISVNPGSETVTGDIHMQLLSEDNGGNGDGNGDGDGNGGGGGESGGAAALIVSGISEQAINIQETGGIVHSAVTFVVQDSSGRNITSGQSETVHFEIVSGPGGGEALTPESAETDGQGQVVMNLTSGYTAGVVKVQAVVEREDEGLTIQSKPITIAIHGGYPDQDHFSIAIETYNFEGFSVNGNRTSVSVIVGDKFSNPVKPGTPVYFSTTGGVIQGSGMTDQDGQITVDLISGNPRPADGYAEITAVTYDEDDNEVSDAIPVLFSGPPSADKITVTPEDFHLPQGTGKTYALTVTDINDNPLPSGTTVTVELESEILTLAGDTDITIPNTLSPGTGVTDFTFSVRDLDEENTDDQDYDITVSVNTAAGFSASRTFSD